MTTTPPENTALTNGLPPGVGTGIEAPHDVPDPATLAVALRKADLAGAVARLRHAARGLERVHAESDPAQHARDVEHAREQVIDAVQRVLDLDHPPRHVSASKLRVIERAVDYAHLIAWKSVGFVLLAELAKLDGGRRADMDAAYALTRLSESLIGALVGLFVMLDDPDIDDLLLDLGRLRTAWAQSWRGPERPRVVLHIDRMRAVANGIDDMSEHVRMGRAPTADQARLVVEMLKHVITITPKETA